MGLSRKGGRSLSASRGGVNRGMIGRRKRRDTERDMADAVECVVAGAGVIGLAVARALALQGREVLVLERERLIGTHTSSRNSEVIHAGLYYPKGSFKARFCLAGKQRLYAYCAERGIEAR